MIEWTEPTPCKVTWKRTDGLRRTGLVDGEPRFIIESVGDRHARLTDAATESLFISSSGCVEDGFETHVEMLQDAAECILKGEEG